MDGYHISQSKLNAIGELGLRIGDDSVEVATAVAGNQENTSATTTFDDLMRRRGAPWTFDVNQLCKDLQAAKMSGEGSFPIYDRNISDPVPDQICVTKEHCIIFCEGNYLLALDDSAFKPLEAIWDGKWLINVPESVLKDRLVHRHLKTWTAAKEERFGKGRAGAEAKTESSDLKNARWVYQTSRAHADLVIHNA